MAENATLALPKDLIEPIIQTHIQNALAEAFNQKDAIISKMAWQILNQHIDSEGKPCDKGGYRDTGTFLESTINKMMREAFKECLAQEMEKHKETLRGYLTKEMAKSNSKLVKAIAEGLVEGLVTNGLKYSLTVEMPKN